MERIRNIYFAINFSWPKVLVYAVICGVTCGLVMMCHALDNTSIHQFGVTMEAWLFLGLPLCTNSKTPLESALKLFVFFLVSQPLVYLTMWPEYQRFPWEYYQYWLCWTFACLPMGFLAWYIKKGNALGVVVVVLACAAELLFGIGYVKTLILNFPQHLLAAVFCLAQVPLYIALFLSKKSHRVAAAAASVVIAGAIAAFVILAGPNSLVGLYYEGAGECVVSSADPSIVSVESALEDDITLRAKGYGQTTLTVVTPDGRALEYPMTVLSNGLIEVQGLPR